MAAWRSTTDRKTPRFNRRLVRVAKKVSTAFSQEHEVGVKWKVKRGWRASQERLDARRPGFVVQQAINTFRGEALLPAPDAGLRLAGATHDRDGAQAVGRIEHDLGAPDVLLRRVAVADDRL